MIKPMTDTREWSIVLVVSTFALLFRIAAWLSPSSFVVVPPSVAVPLNGLGVLFLACGVWAWAKRPTALTRVFLAYAVGMGFHWGGSIGTQGEGVHVALLALYAAASAMGDGAFLDLSLRYPGGAPRRALRAVVFYLLAIITLLAAPAAPFLPRASVGSGIAAVIGLAFLMSIAGSVTFLVKWLRATPAERRAHALTPIVAALVVSGALDLLGDSGLLSGEPAAWQLTYGIIPIALAWALTRGGVMGRPSGARS